MSVEAFPLYWPEGWKRTRFTFPSKFKTGFGAARNFLNAELRHMGARKIVLSTNIPLRNDGQPCANMPEPRDAGVAVYFTRNGKAMVFACDKFKYTRDNIYAIGKTIEALRGIERWGASDMMERTFTGFKALNAENAGESWWTTLQLTPDATEEQIQTSYRAKARSAHPDTPGGSHAAMQALNTARDQALMATRNR